VAKLSKTGSAYGRYRAPRDEASALAEAASMATRMMRGNARFNGGIRQRWQTTRCLAMAGGENQNAETTALENEQALAAGEHSAARRRQYQTLRRSSVTGMAP